MKIKSMVAAVAIALSSLGVNAVPIPTLTTPVSVTGTFNDVLLGSVTVPTLSDVSGGVGYMLTFRMFGTDFNLPTVTFGGVKLGSHFTTLGVNNTFSFTDLATGSYDLKASGSVANNGTNWISASYTVTTVPEPETFAMLLAGLGLIGTIGRRRSIGAANA